MNIKQKLQELKNKSFTKEELRKLREQWSHEYKNSRHYAPLNEGISDIQVEFKVDEDGDTIFTDGYNYLILGNEEVMDLPDEQKMKMVLDILNDFKNDEFMNSEYDYWMSVLKHSGLLYKNMELPKLTKEIAKQINDNYQKLLKHKEFKEALKDNNDIRKTTLAEYLGVPVESIEDGYNEKVFEVDGDEWLVVTYEEAEEEAEESIRNIFDDIGLESFTESFRDWIINNAVDTNEIEDWMLDSYRSYVDDIEYENDYTYGNRLIQELYDNGLLKDDDFEVEDGEILYDELKDSIILDDKKEEYAQQLADSNNPMDWLHEIYTDEEIGKILEENNLIDMDAVVEECIRQDGIAHFISTYDGVEHDLGNGLYGYRL